MGRTLSMHLFTGTDEGESNLDPMTWHVTSNVSEYLQSIWRGTRTCGFGERGGVSLRSIL